jgi:hypothetical protein
MVVDCILDRKDGSPYNPREFYQDMLAYEANDISRAMDEGTEEDVKKALCDYIKFNDYNPAICDYINSVNWLTSSNRRIKMDKKPVKSSEDKEKWWYGVPGIRMIWHGEWSDPELECDGYVANYWDVENTMYEYAKEDGVDADNDDVFAQYVRDHAYDAKYLVTECGTKEEDDDDFIDSGCHGKTKKKAKKPVQSMARGYLQPQYDGRASFYNKAEFDDDKLYSYGTLVAEIVDGKPVLYPDWDYSATTIRHVREFLRQHGFTADSKAQIAKDYLTNARKPVKSSMSVEELPREALQELKQRYYAEKYDEDLSYGELADIDDIVSDEEVFDEYGGTSFTEDDFFCLANSRKPVKSSMPGKEKGIQAIMDEYGCTREEAIEIMNEEIQNSRKPVKSSNGLGNEVSDLQIDMTNTGYFEDGWLLLNVVGDGPYNVNGRPDDTEFTINAYGPNGEDLGSKKFDFLELWHRG